MLTVQMFYKHFGVRNLGQVRAPKVVPVNSLEFPMHATLYPMDETVLDTTLFPVSQLTGTFFVKNVFTLSTEVGAPRLLPYKKTTLRKKVQDIGGRLLTTTLEAATTQHTILVNHTPILESYHYKTNLVSTLDASSNYINTVIDSILSDTTDRAILLSIPVPDSTPDKQWFKMAETKPKLWLKNHAANVSDIFWLELNKYWIGEQSWFTPLRGKSIIFMFHYKNNAVLVHNVLFNVTADASEKLDSAGLVQDIARVSPLMARSFLPILLTTIKENISEEAPLVHETTEPPLTDEQVGTATPIEDELVIQANGDKSLMKSITQAAQSVDPYHGHSLGTVVSVPPEASALVPTVIKTAKVEEAYKNITTQSFDTQYVSKGLYRVDLMNGIKGIQAAGILVTGVQSTIKESLLGDTEVVRVSVKGLDGNASTLQMTLPVLNADGGYTLDGTDYRMRKQRVEPPIIKVSPSKVVLNSYYGTLFVTRSTKAVDDIGRYYARTIGKLVASNPESHAIPLDVFDYTINTPTHYAKLSQYYKSIHLGACEFYLDYHTRDQVKGYSKSLEKNGVVCGTYQGSPMVMTFSNRLTVDNKDIGTVSTLLGLPTTAIPIEYAQMKIMGVEIPLGVFLGSRVGLTSLLNKGMEWVMSDKRSHPDAFRTFTFKDTYVHLLSVKDPKYLLIINSFTKMKEEMSQYAFDTFNYPDIYQLWVEAQGLAVRYFNEFELMDKLFIDDVSTRELLREMGEPTEFKALIIRASELLNSEQHSRSGDGTLLRIRGNERIPGFVYKALTVSVRGYKNTTNVHKRKMELAPWEVFNLITGDNSVKPTENNNPIQYVKERETITLSGMSGRSSQTMTTDNRRFDPNDLGFIGEAGTDNGDVGMITFMSASPKMEGLRGKNNSTIKDAKEAPVSCYTTSYMLTPAVTKDHMPRVSFVNIQNTHNIAIEGAETPYVRTGYEYIFPHKVGKAYAWMAEQDGKVLAITDSMITIQYADGRKENGPLGIVPGKSGDKLYPHTLVTTLTTGSTFKQEDPLTYNSAFFKQDDLYENKLCYVQAKFIDTAYIDDLYTYEDSCTLTKALTDDLTTKKLVFKRVVVNATDAISESLNLHDTVGPDTPLAVVTDAIGIYSGRGDSDTLKDLLASIPRAGTKGVVVNIEVLYYCEYDELSKSLQSMVDASDKRISQARLANNKTAVGGKIGPGHRINGTPMQPGTVEIRYFILAETGVGRGDKFVFGAQLKATVGAVFDKTHHTVNGLTYDATFSYRSVLARIVHSYQDTGAYSRFMDYFGRYLAAKL